MRHTEVDAIRERLQQRLDEFTKRAGKIENDLRTPRNPDWEDRVTETENDEVLESLESSARRGGPDSGSPGSGECRHLRDLPDLRHASRRRASGSGSAHSDLHQLCFVRHARQKDQSLSV